MKTDNPLQIGVIGSRIRAKLAEHYAESQVSSVRIDLSRRGYEAVFAYRPHFATRRDRVDILIANAKTAIDQRTLPGTADALSYLDKALGIAPEQPLLLSLKAYCYATRALYGTIPRQDLERAAAIVERTRVVEERPWESWFAQACVQMALHWDWPGGAGELRSRDHVKRGKRAVPAVVYGVSGVSGGCGESGGAVASVGLAGPR